MNGQNIAMAFLKNMGILGMTYTLCSITIKMVNSFRIIALTLLYKDIESKLLSIFLYLFYTNFNIIMRIFDTFENVINRIYNLLEM